MRAGQMRWPITIQSRTPTRSSTGAEDYTWTDFATVFADMQTQARRSSRSAWETFVAQQEHAVRVILFDIRYIPGIDETMRVKDQNGLVYDIKAIVNVDSRNRELWLMCEYGMNQG